jgi:hypothetical protein
MNLNKPMFLNIAIAIIGGAIISLIPGIPSAVSFIVGVVAATIVFKLFLSTPSITEQDEDSALPTKTLYVGNLPYKANESHVRDLFAQHGDVFAVRLMKDKRTGKRRGFGFVVMAATHAQSAIDALHAENA